MQPVGLQLHRRPRIARTVGTAGRQHDLIRHRRQVDLVRFLMQVVPLGEILRAEVVPDVGRLAMAVPLLRELRWLLGDRERLQLARVGQVVVLMTVIVLVDRAGYRAQGEEQRKQLIEQLVVAPVLDQGHAQRRPQRLPVGEYARLRGGQHGVGRLGDRHARAEQPQQADEPMQAAFHVRLAQPGRRRVNAANDRLPWP